MYRFVDHIKDKLTDLFHAFVFLLLLPIIIIFQIVNIIYVFYLRIAFFLKWKRNGKDIIFVYSDSPNWKDYIEENVLPVLGSRCITIKWSKHKIWSLADNLEYNIFRHWGGYKEFNPMAIIYLSFFNIKTVRFYKAFRDYKHGKDNLLNERLEELFNIVGIDKT